MSMSGPPKTGPWRVAPGPFFWPPATGHLLMYGRSVSTRALPLLRPNHALILLGHRSHAFIHELLHALAVIRLGGVDVAFGIRRDAVDRVELAGLPAAVAEHGEDFHRVALDDVDMFVRSIDQVDELLVLIL